MLFSDILAMAVQQGGGAAAGGGSYTGPTFVSATGYATSTSDAATWQPFTSLDISDCAVAVFVLSVDAGGGAGALTTASSGWTASATGIVSNNSVQSRVFYKIAPTNNETLLFDLDANDVSPQQASGILIRINNANTVVAAAGVAGNSTNADPPSKDAGAVREHLWVAAASFDAVIVALSAPSSYINLTTQAAGGLSGASTAIATRELSASQTEDPGAFTSTTEQWVGWTVAVYHT